MKAAAAMDRGRQDSSSISGATPLICMLAFLLGAGTALAESADSSAAEESAAKAPEAQTHCSAEVFYSWERHPDPEEANKNKRSPQASKKKMKSAEVSEVHYKAVSEAASTEKEARYLVQLRLESLKAEALEKCQEKHGNMANCVAGGIRKNSGEYRLLDFNAKRVLLDALEKDCRVQSGRCINARAGSISCRTHAPAAKKAAARVESENKKE